MSINKKTKKNLVREKAVKYQVEQMTEVLDAETEERVRLALLDYEAGNYTEVDTSIPGALDAYLDSLARDPA